MDKQLAKSPKPVNALAELQRLTLPKTHRIRKTRRPEPTHRFTHLHELDTWVCEMNKDQVTALNAHIQEERRLQPLASPSFGSSVRLLEIYAEYRGRLETLRRVYAITGEPRDFSIQDEILVEMADTIKRAKEGLGVIE